MIKTPVSRHKMFTHSFVDRFGYFLDGAQTNEAQKRINMHDELVSALRDMVEIVGGNFCQNMEIKRKYKIARELLERCK